MRYERILVTGGLGFIGSAFIRKVLDSSDSIILNVDLETYAANRDALGELVSRDQYSEIICDINVIQESFSQLLDFAPDCIVHFAAESHVDRSLVNPRVFLDTNIVGTFEMLELARRLLTKYSERAKAKFKFLHCSTDEVFGDLDLQSESFSEDSRYAPSSPYSATKAASNHLVRAWARSFGVPINITYSTNNYGPFQHPEKLIPKAILSCLMKNEIPIHGTGKYIRDWLHVDDHVEAILAVLDRGSVGSSFNIGGNCEKFNIDVVTEICSLFKAADPTFDYFSLISFGPDRVGQDVRYSLTTRKITEQLGWLPRRVMATELGSLVRDARNYENKS